MFGTLKPHTCRLGCDRKHEYATFYCGLCKSLGDHFGTLTRALLNYDAVFLALVADSLMETEATPDRCRCPILPVTFRPTVRPDSPAMRYAAAMQMLLSDQWLADRAADGRLVARTARPLLSGKVEAARAILADLGLSLADLDGFEERQARCEVLGETGPREAAAPTAAALSLVFEQMAGLPGIAPEAATSETRASLAAFGKHLGSAIYLIDALDDLEKDLRGGAFNPCLARASSGQELRIVWARIATTWDALHADLAALREIANGLPFRRHHELVRNVVVTELPAMARGAAKRAHAFTRAEEERCRAELRAGSWPRRLAASVATIFVLLWVWLASIPAFAKGEKRPVDAGARDAGARDAGTAGEDGGSGRTAPWNWEPKLPEAPKSETPAPAPTDQGEDPAPKGTGSPSPPKAPAPGGGPGGGGGSCDNPCRSCGSSGGASGSGSGSGSSGSSGGGGGGGNPCGACSDCCSGCCKNCGECNKCTDCGSCCKECGSCDSCCKGCCK
jgi:hypothetical protein